MKILWVVNIIFPYPSMMIGKKPNPFGGWLMGLFNEIIKTKKISLGIACVYDGNELLEFEDNSVKYYLIPRKNQFKMWNKAIYNFNPCLIHLHGTEFEYGYIIQKMFPHIKTVVSIQGLVSIYADYYVANIKHDDIYKNLTIKSLIKGNIYKEQKQFIKKGEIEKTILKNSTGIIGRTTWDYACSLGIVGEDRYYLCNESLRDSFYNAKWSSTKIEKHSVFVSQAGYPIKGFHIMIEAANLLKNQYGFLDLKVYVAGNNIIDISNLKQKIKLSNYAKYILNLINKYNLQDNIIFTGLLSEKEMLERLLLSNVFVQSSSIENSPNSLGEAMLIGMPCIASDVGGTADMMKDKEEGFLYPFGDYSLLAYYISKIFNDNSLSKKIGLNASKHASITHDRKQNAKKMIEIYTKLVNL